MKKLIVIFLLLAMLLPHTAYAEGKTHRISKRGITEIAAVEVENELTPTSRPYILDGRLADFSVPGSFVEYRLNAEKAGLYHASLCMGNEAAAKDVLNVYIDGVLQPGISVDNVDTGNFANCRDRPFFPLELPQGEIIMKLEVKQARLGDLKSIKFLGCDETIINSGEYYSADHNNGENGWTWEYYDVRTQQYHALEQAEEIELDGEKHVCWVLPKSTDAGFHEVMVGKEFIGQNVNEMNTEPKTYAVRTYTAERYARILISYDGEIIGNTSAGGYGWRKIKIMKNEEQIWPQNGKEWRVVKGLEKSVDYSVETLVQPGDKLFFVVADASHLAGNMTHYTHCSALKWTPILVTNYLSEEEYESLARVRLPQKAYPSDAAIFIDGRQAECAGYNIGDNNFYKLRDIAAMFSGSAKQFSVEWKAENDSVYLLSRMPYSGRQSDDGTEPAAQKTAFYAMPNLFKDGVKIQLMCYNIEDNNYFKLRDIASAFDFGIEWDETSGVIRIDTEAGYEAILN